MPSRGPRRTAAASPRSGIDRLVPVVGLADVVDEPPREERRQRELGVHDQLGAVLRGLAEQVEHPLHDVLAGVIALHRPELRGSDGEHS